MAVSTESESIPLSSTKIEDAWFLVSLPCFDIAVEAVVDLGPGVRSRVKASSQTGVLMSNAGGRGLAEPTGWSVLF